MHLAGSMHLEPMYLESPKAAYTRPRVFSTTKALDRLSTIMQSNTNQDQGGDCPPSTAESAHSSDPVKHPGQPSLASGVEGFSYHYGEEATDKKQVSQWLGWWPILHRKRPVQRFHLPPCLHIPALEERFLFTDPGPINPLIPNKGPFPSELDRKPGLSNNNPKSWMRNGQLSGRESKARVSDSFPHVSKRKELDAHH